MGSVLAETTLVHKISQLIQPIRNIFAAVFFVSVGMADRSKNHLATFTHRFANLCSYYQRQTANDRMHRILNWTRR